MSYEKLFKLKTNPFRMTPALSPPEIIWAGFPELKEKLENRIKRSIRISSSSLVLNWGEYGSGKTHAARYFNRIDVLEKLSNEIEEKIPFSLFLTLPRSRDPVYGIFVSIIDKIDIQEIRQKFTSLSSELSQYIDKLTDNLLIRNVLKALFRSDVDATIVRKYLYGNITKNELSNLGNYGILRTLSAESDFTKIVSGLFSCFTFEKKVFSSVIIWIDEFEDIAIFNTINVDKMNNFIRELLDNAPNNLLIFLNLTLTALVKVEDLGQYLTDAVTSRIREMINFGLPTEEQLFLYLEELLNNELFRTEKVPDPLFPFNKEIVSLVIKELGNVSLRRFNEAFSLLLEIAELEGASPIDRSFFEKNKDEIIGWKR